MNLTSLFFNICVGKLTNMSRLSGNEKRWNLWLGSPMARREFYRTRCPSPLMYGASQGEAAKSGYSKITLGTSKIKDSNVVKFLCRCKTGGYSNGILLKKRHQSKILWGGISVKGHRGVKCSSYTEEGWKRGRHQCRQKHQWLQKVQRLNTRRDNKAILIVLCIWWGRWE